MQYQALRLFDLAVLVCALASSAAALAGNALPTTIDVAGASETRACGINKTGEIVGYYAVSSSGNIQYHGFLLDKGRLTTIDFPGSYGTEAYGINAAGQIVGVYWDANGAAEGSHAFLLTEGRFTAIDARGAVDTRAFGINDAGQVVGVYTVNTPPAIPGFTLDPEYDYEYGHGFVYAKGRFTTIDVPGARRGEQTMASGINAAGQIVGSYIDKAHRYHGFVLTKGHYSDIDFPEARDTFAIGINKDGEIAGNFAYSAGYGPGFLLAGKRFGKIDFTHVLPDTLMTHVYGINEAGSVVGYYETAKQGRLREHGFVLSP